MFPNIPREITQFISLLFLTLGIAMMVTSPAPLFGVASIGFSCWILMISESALHAKVQHEMSVALEALRNRQSKEIQELLDFLERSRINSSPMETASGMMMFIDTLPYPAFVMSSSMGIIKANAHLTKLLGWSDGELNGKPALRINDASVMSGIGAAVSDQHNSDKKEISLRYVYVHKKGDRIWGNLHVVKIPDGSFFMVFHPDADNIVTDDDLAKLLAPRD